MVSLQRLRWLAPLLILAAAFATLPRPAEPSNQNRLYIPYVGSSYRQADERFGLIATGDVADALTRLGAAWWFSWGQPTPGEPYHRVAQISLRAADGGIKRVPVATLQDGARQHPGGFWIVGNEPNVPGQDNVSPDEYAVELKYYYDAIKGADPTAQLVGPNVLNFDFTCSGCQGFTPGRDWLDAFRATWAQRYGGEPPVDVWGLHAYLITWDRLPMTEYETVQRQIAAFADYLGAIPAHQTRPVWLTEFGIIWAYPGYTWSDKKIAPDGDYDDAGVRAFLNQMLSWLKANTARYRLGKWFLYTTYGQPEPYTTSYGGISLMTGPSTGSPLTAYGLLYRQFATR